MHFAGRRQPQGVVSGESSGEALAVKGAGVAREFRDARTGAQEVESWLKLPLASDRFSKLKTQNSSPFTEYWGTWFVRLKARVSVLAVEIIIVCTASSTNNRLIQL